MNVRVDESGQQETAAQIDHGCLRVLSVDLAVIAAGGNAAVVYEQRAISEALQRAFFVERIARSMEDRRSQQFALAPQFTGLGHALNSACILH